MELNIRKAGGYMTLKDFLNERKDDGKYYKVGFNKGSNFVFCDKIDGNAIKEFEKIYKEYVDILNKKVERYRYNLENIDSYYNHLITMKRVNCKNKYSKSKKEVIKSLNKKIEKTEKKIKKFSNFEEYINSDVVEEYTSVYEDNTNIVICKGDMNGKYWIVKEYKL